MVKYHRFQRQTQRPAMRVLVFNDWRNDTVDQDQQVFIIFNLIYFNSTIKFGPLVKLFNDILKELAFLTVSCIPLF